MSTWREAAFLLNFTPDQFQAYLLDDVIRSKGSKSNAMHVIPLADFLNKIYLECLIGDTDLNYDAISHMLVWRAMRRMQEVNIAYDRIYSN